MPVLLELEKDILEPLELIAKNKSKDVGYIIAEIVDEYLERLSDDKLLKIARNNLKSLDNSKSIILELKNLFILFILKNFFKKLNLDFSK